MASSIMIAALVQMIVVAALIGGAIFVVVRLARAGGGNAASAAKAMADPVAGTFLVTAAAMPSRNALYHMTRITGVVSGEGIEPTAVQYSGLIRTALWPSPGKQLPVIVDRADPQNFAIQWDEVRSTADSALDQAEALAAAMRARGGDPPA